VISCECVPAGFDEFGQVKSGRLQLSGLYIDVILTYHPNTTAGLLGKPPLGIRCRLLLQDGRTFEMEPDYDFTRVGANYIPMGARVSCMRMSSVMQGLTKNLVSLVLHPVDSKSKDFEQIGLLILKEEASKSRYIKARKSGQ